MGCDSCVVGATLSCVSDECICVPTFFDLACGSSFYAVRPVYFNAYFALTLVLYFFLFGYGLLLVLGYIVRYYPKVQQHNPQFLGIITITIASCFKLISSIIHLSFGPTIGLNYFMSPTLVYGVVEGLFEIFYPLIVTAFAIQIVLWILFVVKSKESKTTNSCWKPPVLAGFYFSFVALLIVFSIVAAVLLVNLRSTSYAFLIFYRVYLAFYLLGLLVVAVIFAVQMLLAVNEVKVLSGEFKKRRQRLAAFVVVTCVILLIGVAIGLAQISPSVSTVPDVYFGFLFLNLFIETFAITSIFVTFTLIFQTVRDEALREVDTRSLEAATTSDSISRSQSSLQGLRSTTDSPSIEI